MKMKIQNQQVPETIQMSSRENTGPPADNLADKKKAPPLLFSMRSLLSLIIFLGYAVQYMQRSNMGIAIVCMVNSTVVLDESTLELNKSSTCSIINSHSKSTKQGKFFWSKSTQGLILSSFFYGYILPQIVSGWLSVKYGPKIILLIAFTGTSLTTLLTPVAANWSYVSLIFVRFLTGFFSGLAFPSFNRFYARWAPPSEISRLIGFSSAGINAGSVVALFGGGYLCEIDFYEGWGSIFVIFGLAGVLWLILLLTLTYNTPAEHPLISEREKAYIIQNLPEIKVTTNMLPKTPWLKIFKSKPCIGIFVAHFTANFGAYLLLTQSPTFMSEVLNFDIRSNGLYSAIPYILSAIMTSLSGLIADKLIVSGYLSKTNTRRLFNSLGLIVPALAIIGQSFVNCEQPIIAVFLLTIGVGFIGLVAGSGYIVNINEVGGAYSSILYGISNTFATVPGIVAPYMVGFLTPNGTLEEWRVVFIITAVIYSIGAFVFALFCRTDVDDWAVEKQTQNDH